MKLTVAMPVYNEEKCLERVLNEVQEILNQLSVPSEVLVVDDASVDSSPQILTRLSTTMPRLRVLTQSENMGIAGFNKRILKEARGQYIFIASSDGESDYNDVSHFLKLAEEKKLDAVLGVRRKKNYTLYRKTVSFSFGLLVAILFGRFFRDIGWIRLIQRSSFTPLPQYCESAFAMAEQLLVASHYGAKFEEVEVTHRPRYVGKGSGAKPKKVVSAFKELLQTRLRFFLFHKFYKMNV